jgi:hypothetical protein
MWQFAPGKAVDQHRQLALQIDHLIQTVVKKVIHYGAVFKSPRRQTLLNIYLRALIVRINF